MSIVDFYRPVSVKYFLSLVVILYRTHVSLRIRAISHFDFVMSQSGAKLFWGCKAGFAKRSTLIYYFLTLWVSSEFLSKQSVVLKLTTQKNIFNCSWRQILWTESRKTSSSTQKIPLFVILVYLYPAKYFIKVDLRVNQHTVSLRAICAI